MNYNIRKGLVHESVCGQELLVATLEARKHCPYLTELNEASAFVWHMLEDGLSREQMREKIVKVYDISAEAAAETLDLFLADLEKQGFITRGE